MQPGNKTYHIYKCAISLIVVIVLCRFPSQAQQPVWKQKITNYLASLNKPGGGYGWADQPDAHLTPTFAALGILDAIGLNHDPAAARRPLYDSLFALLQRLHPQTGLNKEGGNSGTEMRDLIYQQIQAMRWIGADPGYFRSMVTNWSTQKNKVANFETHGHPVFMQELMKIFCYDRLAMPADTIRAGVMELLQSRRRANGSYNNAPAEEGGDGNLLNTYFGVKAFKLCGSDDTIINPAVAAWIKRCQRDDGTFMHQPAAEIGAGSDVIYAWAAISSLVLLKQDIPRREKLIRWLLSLQNQDGGFGKTPGQPSDPVAAFYAVTALKQLSALEQLAGNTPILKTSSTTIAYNEYKIYSAQFEAPGFGSPEEAAFLAKQLKIDLWGTKNDASSWVARASQSAKAQGSSVSFFNSDEPYGKNVHIPGMGTFNHILDYISPLNTSVQFADSPVWKSFRTETLQPLLDKKGALIWQVSNNEPLARMLLDETVLRGGYAAISTIHFSQNFLFWLPFLYQYRHQLPFIALQDAHGSESWWWANELAGYRNLYLAKKPGYDGLIHALKNNLVVAVRRDSVSSFRIRMLGGAPGLQGYLRKRTSDWQWWVNDNDEPGRPWAVISVLKNSDSAEAYRPAMGINIRIRTWWRTSLQYLLDEVVKPEILWLDGEQVAIEYQEKKDNKGQRTDAVYIAHLPIVKKGKHVIRVTVRHPGTNRVKTLEKTFII